MNTNQLLLNFIYTALFDRPSERTLSESEAAAVFSSAKKNAVSSLVFRGIQKSGADMDKDIFARYSEERDKDLYVYLMQAQQITAISNLLEKHQIPFIVLKGGRMRDYYPSPELRTSTDIDILARAEDETLCRLMQNAGFTYEKDGGTTLNFSFASIVEIEIHRHLFDEKLPFHSYFDSIWERAHRKEGWAYQLEMSAEDFFVNMIAHFAKHFSRYGCGIRNAIDLVVYLKNAPQSFSLSRAEEILKQIGLYDFEQRLLQLLHAWESDDWSQENKELTDYILGCGLFGSTKTSTAHTITNSSDKRARQKSLLIHFFPNFRTMSNLYPVLKKCPVLLPFCWIARCFRLLFSDRKKIKKTLQLHSQIDEKAISEVNDILHKMHLEEFGAR